MSYRIVVADKDRRSRDEVARYLLAQDNEFINVSSSAELKQAIKSHKPDLIILNAVLEDAPGWRLVQKIKDSKEYADVPVLLMTGDPGGPPPAQMHSTGADRYLNKPIDGTVLRSAVESLLGISSSEVVEEGDEEILIDFTDEDSGDMTEELLAMSNVAMQHGEPSTAVGDTVEIDTGTLVAELDHPGEPGEETYEDTVRLNLEDMGLEEELDDGNSFEPTIELISDIPSETPSTDEAPPEVRLDSDETLPDFSAVSSETGSSEYAGRDSVTVDMDVDELGLELDTDEVEEGLPSESSIDLDDTEIGQILEVQEPSKVLTSEDLLLDDDSLVKDTSADTRTTDVDVIDLEEDTELREIEIEELEPVHANEEAGLGLDLEETVPVEGLEMEQLANEDLDELTLEETADIALDIESPLESAAGYEELTLEETGPEEITTQEFFGEELPTEEFPTEKFPEDKTGEVGLEQEISLEDVAFERELALESEGALEVPLEELTLDTASAEEILFEETREEEPVLEVTEDISFDEITLHEFPERPDMEKIEEPVPAPRAERAAVAPPFAVTQGATEFEKEPLAAAAATPSIPRTLAPDIAGIVSSVVGSQFDQAMPGRAQFAESADTSLKVAARSKDDLFEAYDQALGPALPSKEELLESVVKGIAVSIPSREEISSRIDRMIAAQLPSREAMARKVDEAIKDVLPPAGEVMRRVDRVLQGIPSPEEINKRFDRAVGALPTTEALLDRIESVFKASVPEGDIRNRFHEAISALPVLEAIKERLDKIISPDLFTSKVGAALEALPTKEHIETRLESGFAAITSDMVLARLNLALQAFPSSDQVMDRINQSLDAMPSADAVLSRVEQQITSLMPTKEEISAAMREMLSSKLDATFSEAEVEGAISKILPSSEQILDVMRGALPERDRLQEILTQSLAQAIHESLPERIWLETVSRGLFDERTRGSLPKKEEVVDLLRQEIRGKLLDAVEKTVREQIEKITSELSS